MRVLLVVLMLTGMAVAQTTPEAVAGKLYAWLLKADFNAQKRLPEVQQYLTPELYDLLDKVYKLDSNEGVFLDFDPWSNSQMGAEKYDVGKSKLVGGIAKVPITVHILRGGIQKYTCMLKPAGDSWQVANLVYTPDFDLLSVLKDLLKQAATPK